MNRILVVIVAIPIMFIGILGYVTFEVCDWVVARLDDLGRA